MSGRRLGLHPAAGALEATRLEMKAQRLATESQAAEVKRANELQVRAQLLAVSFALARVLLMWIG